MQNAAGFMASAEVMTFVIEGECPFLHLYSNFYLNS